MIRVVGVIFILFSLLPCRLFGQKDSTSTGIIRGVAFDSVHNYILENATVAIYKADNSVLIDYQLTNNFGSFQFERVPVGTPLKLVLSYAGYNENSMSFSLSKTNSDKNFGKVYLMQKENKLEEVIVVYKPPIRMNKDTLEFNADAFNTSENAVVEDLLKKLPGITVWGDGSITVNGKEVKSLLVNGKPFLGGSTRVAIQNIPKDAVEKVQVYQQGQSTPNTRDSTTEVNIKLKPDKDFGYFGKFALGQSNINRNEQNGGLNWFTPLTQLGLIASRNNTNRIGGNAVNLLENNTFKGGSDIDYQPQFNLPGLNKIFEGGFIFQRDFIEKTDFYNKNRLDANYYLNHNNNTVNRNSETITAISKDENIATKSAFVNNSTYSKQQFNSKYDKKINRSAFSINSSAFFNHAVDETSSSNLTFDNFKTIQSRSDLNKNGVYDNNSLLLNSSYEQELTSIKNNSQNKRLRLNYSASLNQVDENRVISSVFNSLTMPSQSRIINRSYNTDKANFENRFAGSLENLGKLNLIGGRSLMFGFDAEVLTTSNKINDKVYDKPDMLGDYEINPLLTNKAHFRNLSVSPSINIANSISKVLSNRYEKGFTTSLNIREQFSVQKVISSHDFQNSHISYHKFVPEVLVKYVNYHFNHFKDVYSLKFTKHVSFPVSEQLLLIADSSDIYQMRAGNPQLRPSDVQDLSIEMSHSTMGSRSQFSYSAYLQIGQTKNYIGDSSIIYKNGQTNYYYVNLPSHHFLNSSLSLNKSFKINEQTIQIMVSTKMFAARVPGILNGLFNLSDVYQHNNEAKIYYHPVSFLGLTIGHNWFLYKIQQSGASYEFKSVIHNSNLNLNSDLTSRLTLNSNISFVYNRFTGGKTNYNIWNANASYRLLKKKNAEIKFSAFDLLKENSSISYIGTNTSLSTIYNNVLQQYFMLTFSFFPRKFGR